jgi:hypothetical protein
MSGQDPQGLIEVEIRRDLSSVDQARDPDPRDAVAAEGIERGRKVTRRREIPTESEGEACNARSGALARDGDAVG